jgi:AcrR family transcriptional regulator
MSTQDALEAERLFATALRLFQQRGYPSVTLTDIAAEAGVHAEELFRHFPRKERFVFRLYERLAADLEAGAAELPAGTVAERAAAVLGARDAPPAEAVPRIVPALR